MQQPARNQQYVIIDVLILILSAFITVVLMFVPTISTGRSAPSSAMLAIVEVFPFSIPVSIILLVIVVTFIGMGIMPILRLLRVNLVQINRSASIASALIYVLGLARTNTENDTGFLGIVLSGVNIIAMILLNLMTQSGITLQPIYIMIFILGTIPLALLNMLYLPNFRKLILSGAGIVASGAAYISVESGRLVGAEPRIDPQTPFYIGKRNNAQLVLFDELYVRDDHLCIYYDNNRPMLVAYDNIYLNNQAIQANVAHPLTPGDEIQVGQTKIKFKM